MPRFVLLRHECPASFGKPSHWDFMLEWGDVLWTWELAELPNGWQHVLDRLDENREVPAGAAVRAIRLPDHRLAYLDFEGSISGNRGTVRRCDQGDFEFREQGPGRLVIRIEGARIRGEIELESPAGDENWLLLAGRG